MSGEQAVFRPVCRSQVEKTMPITLDALEKIVRAAGEVAMSYFNDLDQLAINKKAARDLVTDADVAVENYLKQALTEQCPEYGFWGEETNT